MKCIAIALATLLAATSVVSTSFADIESAESLFDTEPSFSKPVPTPFPPVDPTSDAEFSPQTTPPPEAPYPGASEEGFATDSQTNPLPPTTLPPATTTQSPQNPAQSPAPGPSSTPSAALPDLSLIHI